ncbi:MAG TPA: dicarboxylate/amino acid:cation symporter [Opitutaceae bacterium]
MNVFKLKLHWQIFLALGAGALLGTIIQVASLQESAFASGLNATCDFLGDLFMNALRMIMVPLIVSTVIAGVMALGSEKDFGRLGLKTFVYYTITGAVAVVTGLFFVNLLAPGRVSEETAQAIVGQAEKAEQILTRVERRGAGDMVDIFLRMIPPNIIEAAADNGQLLGLIVVSLVIGFFISKLPDPHRGAQMAFWESAQALMMRVTDFIIRFAPIGVFGLVTPIIVRTGFGLFKPLALFFFTVLLSLAFHFFINLGLLLKVVGRINPIYHYRAMAPVLVMAFSTASSTATLPVTLETVQKNAGVSSRISSFTLPLGATVNMDGTALYECVVVVFIAQIYGVIAGFQFGLAEQFSVVVLALLTSVGVAGIPAASLVAITVILGVVGLPLEAVGLVWVTDRILDMCRTAVNVFSDTCGAAIIARTEGEAEVYSEAVLKSNEAI